MAKRCSRRRSLRNNRRTRRGGVAVQFSPLDGEHVMRGGRKKMMRTRRRTRRGGTVQEGCSNNAVLR